jgi:hypothetical protein
MRKVILLVMVTIDGFFDAPGEGLEKINWHHADIVELRYAQAEA